MKKFLIALLFTTCHIKSALAVNTIFVPVQQNTGISSQITSHTQYGLTDKEIERRIELGLIHTIPISALLKWQESKKNQEPPPNSIHLATPETNIQNQPPILNERVTRKIIYNQQAHINDIEPASTNQPTQNTTSPLDTKPDTTNLEH